MQRSGITFVFLLITTLSFAQSAQKLPDACTLITSNDLNSLLGTVVNQQESNAPTNVRCTFESDDHATEIVVQHATRATSEAAAADLKHTTDSVRMDIANAKPTPPFTAINDLEGAGQGAVYLTGADPIFGPMLRIRYALDKFIVTIETKGVAEAKVLAALPEIIRIIKRNSGL